MNLLINLLCWNVKEIYNYSNSIYLIKASTILYVEAYFFSLIDLYVLYVPYSIFFQLMIVLYALCALHSSFFLSILD